MKASLDKLLETDEVKKSTLESFNKSLQAMNARHDKVFAILFFFQFIFGICIAYMSSPLSWTGGVSSIHIHVYTAVFLGALIAFAPIVMIIRNPGRDLNQWAVTFSQTMFSILLIHLTDGRIETHFHIFVSLAFLSFYRNFNIIIFATVITLLDHVVRGYYWPESIYGILNSGPLRALEHGGWVLFEDSVLYFSIKNSRALLMEFNKVSVQLKYNFENIEALVKIKTNDLIEANKTILNQQESLVQTAKFSALGEMAGGIAHEINNPLTIVMSISDMTQHKLEKGTLSAEDMKTNMEKINLTLQRINKTIKGLRNFSRSGSSENEIAQLGKIISDTIELCEHRAKIAGISLNVECPTCIQINCQPTQISQIMLNLIGNSMDAVEKLDERWVSIKVLVDGAQATIRIIDSGLGIPEEYKEKLMRLFFTTKPAGVGTGLGLSISKNLAEAHGGKLTFDSLSQRTCFVLELPIVQSDVRVKTA